MQSKLISALGNTTYTENSALTNRSTNSAVLDFFYHVPARRGQDNSQLFLDALAEDELLAIKALFYIRDVRQGKGERDTFRKLLVQLHDFSPELFNAFLPVMAEYDRWDDILEFWANENVVRFVQTQLTDDTFSERPSLLGKWMPSENASSDETVALAKHWIAALEMSPRNYRKTLTYLRKKLGVVEVKMSAGEWEDIVYKNVPSRANLIYRKAFSRHDPVGYTAYIAAAKQGKVKINSGVLYPHEIIGRVRNGQYDDTLEALWRQLPEYASGRNVLAVVDVSGSMSFPNAALPKSQYHALDVSIALGIYFAQRNQGAFRNYIITFASTPKLVELKGKNLKEIVYNMQHDHLQGTSTNVQAVFSEVLSAAKRNHVPEDEMPEVIFIISDMQFNAVNNLTNFEAIEKKYAEAGYKLPQLVFWNVASRITETPVTKDQTGTYLASGYSTEAFSKILNLDDSRVPVKTPYELMLNTLDGERYNPIAEVYESYLKRM